MTASSTDADATVQSQIEAILHACRASAGQASPFPSVQSLWSLRHAICASSISAVDLLQPLKEICTAEMPPSHQNALAELRIAFELWNSCQGGSCSLCGGNCSSCTSCERPRSTKKLKGHCSSSSCKKQPEQPSESCTNCERPRSKKNLKGHCSSSSCKKQPEQPSEGPCSSCTGCERPRSTKKLKGHCSSSSCKKQPEQPKQPSEGPSSCNSCKRPRGRPGHPLQSKGVCFSQDSRECERRNRNTEKSAAQFAAQFALPAFGLLVSEAQQCSAPHSVLILGGPGNGKSYIWRHLLWRFQQWLGPQYVAITAVFGIVAQNAGGRTLHSWAGLPLGSATAQQIVEGMSPHHRQSWARIRVIGIDDGSTLDDELLQTLEEVARTIKLKLTGKELWFGGILLIINFDLAQLPPVAPKRSLRFSSHWPRLTNCEHSILVHCQQNKRFNTLWNGLVNRVREGHITRADGQVLQGILSKPLPAALGPMVRLVPRHLLATEFVKQRLGALGDVESHQYYDHYIEAPGGGWLSGESATTTEFKIGVKVLHTLNIGKLANGTMGVVTSFYKISGEVWPKVSWHPVGHPPFRTTVIPIASQSEDDVLPDGRVKSRLPMILAEALSIHKALGMTLSGGEIECSGIWDFAQFYEAISRFRGADYVRVLHFQPSHVKAPKASLEEMRRLQDLAEKQDFDLHGMLSSSTACWQDAESARHSCHGPAAGLAASLSAHIGTTALIELVFAGVTDGAWYYDPGCAGGECAPLTIIKMLETCLLSQTAQQPLQARSGFELTWLWAPLARIVQQEELGLDLSAHAGANACTAESSCLALRSVMAALIMKARQASPEAAAEIATLGAPVQLRAVALLLEAAGVEARLLIFSRFQESPKCWTSKPTREFPGAGGGRGAEIGPGLLLLYCEDRTHLSLLMWTHRRQVAPFLHAFDERAGRPGSSGSPCTYINEMDEASGRLPANGKPTRRAPSPMQWCAFVGDGLEEDGADKRIRGTGEVTLSGVSASILADWNAGRPSGNLELRLDEGIRLFMDAEPPNAADFEGHPTLICKGYLWPRPSSVSGKRTIRISLPTSSGSTALSREYTVAPCTQGEHRINLDASDALTTVGESHHPALPIAASNGRLEYGYFFGRECELVLARSQGHAVIFRGAVAGTPDLPFLRNGPGKMLWEGISRNGHGARGDHYDLQGTWLGGMMTRPQALQCTPVQGSGEGTTTLKAVLDCPRCFQFYSSKTRPKKAQKTAADSAGQPEGVGLSLTGHNCCATYHAPHGLHSAWFRRMGNNQGKKEDASLDNGEEANFDDVDDLQADEWELGDNRERPNVPEAWDESKGAHVRILGRVGPLVYAATRSHLDKSTLQSAGGSSAYCLVQHSRDGSGQSRCFSERWSAENRTM